MDILTHTLSGIAIGTVVASFSNKGFKTKMGIIAIAGFGAALPDFDAISLWSGFDSTIGDFFGLNNSGKNIYFSKYWYSHHAFMHSMLASFIIAIFGGILAYVGKSRFKNLSFKAFAFSIKQRRLYLAAFIFGFILHLLEDMPTPASVWGGVNFFWPSSSYLGGTGSIWWWNNYDIFLIVVAVILINSLALVAHRFIKFNGRKINTIVFFIGLAMALFQINTRSFDFSYSQHNVNFADYEEKSKEVQKEILGDRLYTLMLDFDNKLHIYF